MKITSEKTLKETYIPYSTKCQTTIQTNPGAVTYPSQTNALELLTFNVSGGKEEVSNSGGTKALDGSGTQDKSDSDGAKALDGPETPENSDSERAKALVERSSSL